jgi:hypothetical protein
MKCGDIARLTTDLRLEAIPEQEQKAMVDINPALQEIMLAIAETEGLSRQLSQIAESLTRPEDFEERKAGESQQR